MRLPLEAAEVDLDERLDHDRFEVRKEDRGGLAAAAQRADENLFHRRQSVGEARAGLFDPGLAERFVGAPQIETRPVAGGRAVANQKDLHSANLAISAACPSDMPASMASSSVCTKNPDVSPVMPPKRLSAMA